jgi:uncharacterized protein (TIGR04255 family)
MSAPPRIPLVELVPPATPERLVPAPLRSMLAQVRFAPLQDLARAEVVERIHDRIAQRYPRRLEQQQLAIGPFVEGSTRLWRLTDFSGEWAVVIAPDFLTIETSAYTRWEEVAERLREALDALTSAVLIPARERIGLRYVNEIHREGGDAWETYVNSSLLGIAASPLGQAVRQSLSEVQFDSSPGTVALRHGLVSGDPPTEQFYLLDIDCFDADAVPFIADELIETFASFNDVAFRLFRWSLTDDFYASLREESA